MILNPTEQLQIVQKLYVGFLDSIPRPCTRVRGLALQGGCATAMSSLGVDVKIIVTRPCIFCIENL
jgi:hypothetical protein